MSIELLPEMVPWRYSRFACPGYQRLRIPGHAALCPGHPDADKAGSCYSPIARRSGLEAGANACESRGTRRFAPATLK